MCAEIPGFRDALAAMYSLGDYNSADGPLDALRQSPGECDNATAGLRALL